MAIVIVDLHEIKQNETKQGKYLSQRVVGKT